MNFKQINNNGQRTFALILSNPTLEVILTESPAWLVRKMNEDIDIPLIAVENE